MKKYIGKIIICTIFIILVSNSFFNIEGNARGFVVIAHRGASNIAPEHTMASYKKAVELGTDYIEIDLRMTKDHQLVALHDKTIDRTTNGTGDVTEYTLEELKQFDAGSWFGDNFHNEKIPSLEEILDYFGPTTNYYIETKLMNNELMMEEKLVALLSEKNLLDRVIIQSLSRESLKKIHRMNKYIPLVQLVKEENYKLIEREAIKEYAVGIGPYGPHLDQNYVHYIQSVGLDVHPWFSHSNEQKFIEKVLLFGVDGVFTDYIEDKSNILEKIG